MKKKKVIKQRGSKTHGYGSKKKHRGAGSRGGRGLAGSKKQKKTWIMKYKRDHLGKRGFKSLKQRNIKPSMKAMNIKDLPHEKEVDITKLGYEKLLGTGKIDRPVLVKAKSFSEKAKQKLEKAGGQALEI